LQSVFVRLIGSVLQVVLSVLVARWGGAAVLGQFLVFVAIANVAGSVGAGLPNLVLRHASTASTGDTHTGWLWRHTLNLAVLCLGVAGIAFALGGRYVGLVAVAVGALLLQRVSSSTVKATGRPGLGVLLDTAVWPFVVTAQVVVWQFGGAELTLVNLALGSIAGLALAAVVAVLVSWRSPASVRSAWQAPRRTPRTFFHELAIVTAGAVAIFIAANAPLALAPLFLSDSEAGRLGLALRIAGFATTILVALAAYFSPLYARATTGAQLQALRRQSQMACLALYVPVLLAAVLLPTDWLRQLLGDEFTGVKQLVVILAAGYLLNAATGLTPQLLLMRGRSRDYSLVGAAGAVLTVVGVVLGAWFGGETGLCAGLSIAMVAVNVWGFVVSTRAIRDAPTEAPDERTTQPVT
jgi:O-antigen/teichoic acid export membrane protein